MQPVFHPPATMDIVTVNELGEGKMDDQAPEKSAAFEIGMSLDKLSIDELEATIDLMNREISRLKAAIAAKTEAQATADSFFSR
jgi:uncharacterized small protein (DUF1192 family)